MDGPTLFDKLLVKRGLNPNSLAKAINRATAQSGLDRFRKGLIQQPKRSDALEKAAKHLGVDVLAFYDPALAEKEWQRISGSPRQTAGPPAQKVGDLSPSPAPGNPAVLVPLLANAGSMGHGTDVEHDDVMVGSIALSPDWVAKRVRPTSLEALRFIHAYGDSMHPTFEDGDVLLVDTGRRDTSGADGVYVLATDRRVFIKRVTERFDGAQEVTSDNPTVRTIQELNGKGQIRVLGRVVWVWNGRKL